MKVWIVLYDHGVPFEAEWNIESVHATEASALTASVGLPRGVSRSKVIDFPVKDLLIQQPCPPQDDEVVSVIDDEIQRLATFVAELPYGPARENPTRRIVRLREILDRYISEHSSAGWPSTGAF